MNPSNVLAATNANVYAPPKPSVLPILGTADDLDRPISINGRGSATWQKIKASGAARRIASVAVTVAVTAVCLLVVNVSCVPRPLQCGNPDDCRKVARMNTVIDGVRPILNACICILAAFVVLGQCGVNTIALFSAAGVLGLIIGLGAQSAIKSFIAGAGLLLTDKICVGDYVRLDLGIAGGEVKGVCAAMSMQSIVVVDAEGGKRFVPTGAISVIANYSQTSQRVRVEIVVDQSRLKATYSIGHVMAAMHQLSKELSTCDALRHALVEPPIVLGVTEAAAKHYTIAVTAVTKVVHDEAVERYIRLQCLLLLEHMYTAPHPQ